ncbi:MAG TPA: hypothetical protein PLS66_08015, partial [Tepiditoga sp.]|nr:hypothetical protein [Tepiditoga sp.]
TIYDLCIRKNLSPGIIGTVKDSLFYWGVPYIKTYGVGVQAMNWGMVKPKKKEKIEKNLTKIAANIKKTKKTHVGIKTKFIFNIMKLMHSAGLDSSPVEKEYWNERGWLGKNRPWKTK